MTPIKLLDPDGGTGSRGERRQIVQDKKPSQHIQTVTERVIVYPFAVRSADVIFQDSDRCSCTFIPGQRTQQQVHFTDIPPFFIQTEEIAFQQCLDIFAPVQFQQY